MTSRLIGNALVIAMLMMIVVGCNPPVPSEKGTEFPSTDQMREKGPVQAYERMLRLRVNRQGKVHYAGIRSDSAPLTDYLAYLDEKLPLLGEAPEAAQLAFWINYFNAAVLRLILEHYPVVSVLEIGAAISDVNRINYDSLNRSHPNHPFDMVIAEAGNKKLSLSLIRDSIIRGQFNEPRVHFALVDGTASSPRLRRQIYVSENLGNQLDAAAKEFFGQAEKNVLNPTNPKLSPLMRKYRPDFGPDEGSTVDFVNQYIPIRIRPDAEVTYLDFDWRLNGY